MTTPTPDPDHTEPVPPIPADQLPPVGPPASPAAPSGVPAFAAPEAPAPHAFASPEPATFPTQPVTPVAAPVSTAPARGTSPKVLNLVLGVAVLIAVAGVSFAIGRTTAPASTSPVANVDPNQGGFGPGGNPGDPNGNGNGNNGNGNGPLGGQGPNASFDLNGNGGPGGFDDDGDRGRFLFGGNIGIAGTVQAVTGDSITIQLDGGPTVTFGIDGSTTYHQQADASAGDVTTGKKVIVNLADGFRPDRGALGNGNGSITLGNAGSITIVP